ncbi:MAG TPA: hypothetical protein VNZ01_04965, partial [Solirubrobacteraceae bacterium]|nr:hypothetical protein [Solirubrobacteraceae bacterium]
MWVVGVGDEVLRFLLWRLLGLIAIPFGLVLIAWFLRGGPGMVLRGSSSGGGVRHATPALWSLFAEALPRFASWAFASDRVLSVLPPVALGVASLALLAATRWRSRHGRRYVRLRIEPYRTDTASPESLVRMFDALHKRLLRRWWRRLALGQPSVSLEVHHTCTRSMPARAARPGGHSPAVWLAATCPVGMERMVEAALQTAYVNCRVRRCSDPLGTPPAVLRLKKQAEFIKRVKVLDRFEHERAPPMNRLMTVMGA